MRGAYPGWAPQPKLFPMRPGLELVEMKLNAVRVAECDRVIKQAGDLQELPSVARCSSRSLQSSKSRSTPATSVGAAEPRASSHPQNSAHRERHFALSRSGGSGATISPTRPRGASFVRAGRRAGSSEFDHGVVTLGAETEDPALRRLDRDIVDAGLAPAHQPAGVELP